MSAYAEFLKTKAARINKTGIDVGHADMHPFRTSPRPSPPHITTSDQTAQSHQPPAQPAPPREDPR